MKYYFIICLTCITILSCNKEPENTKPPVQEEPDLVELGVIKGIRDGKPFERKFGAYVYPGGTKLNISGDGKMPYLGGVDEAFSMDRIPLELGKYHFVDYNSTEETFGHCRAFIGWLKAHDQDVGRLKSTDRHPEDFIEIVRFDTLKRTIQGRFQLTLLRTDPDQGWGLPDSTHITDGVFHLKLIE